ncbi:M23 family metallopeptidase [Flavobacterium sp. LM4]|uniref:M23 family metallopeptidase n=1 Tax=Flavobacterium sp. LM4 TaxID=1938609 RepID=UPI000991BC28|nr:M23 family metallopeptidase [Flavobacterium sp. LM4]OOV19828.1 hypothetical protein BXU10_09400 [Flavobacterium sp. LM4]
MKSNYIQNTLLISFLLMVNICLSQNQIDEWCKVNPWLCDTSGALPTELKEIIIIPQKQNPWWPFGFPATTAPPAGWVIIINPQTPANKPCAGDPMKNPTLAPSRPGNYKGGTFGFTRITADGEPKFHDGIDITAAPNRDVFPMYDGEITAIQNSFAADEYRKNSYGNYVEIRSTVNGNIIYLKFNHLNQVTSGLSVGSMVSQSKPIGKSGTTGNAASPGVIPHVHIQAKDENRNKIDPEPLLGTKFNKETGEGTSPCN